MPTDLIHRICIAAPADKIYRAVTTEEGIKGWWTTDVKMDTHAGGKAVFGFENHSIVFQMRIEQLTPPSLVRWKCEENNSPDWIGTTQEFQLEPQVDGEILLKFCHGGWKSGGDHRYYCNTTWGLSLASEYDPGANPRGQTPWSKASSINICLKRFCMLWQPSSSTAFSRGPVWLSS